MKTVSVIIPTLNEEHEIESTLNAVVPQLDFASGDELIISDGGSKDKTENIVKQFPDVQWIKVECGRSLQMNAAAKKAHCDWLLFIHADTYLADGAIQALKTRNFSLDQVGGAYTVYFREESLFFRWIDWTVHIRCKLFSMPYGDQALYFRRDIFEKLGGYREWPILEDVDLVERMRQKGKLVILPQRACSSVRRWEKNGKIKGTLKNMTALMMHKFGYSPEVVYKFYTSKTAPKLSEKKSVTPEL